MYIKYIANFIKYRFKKISKWNFSTNFWLTASFTVWVSDAINMLTDHLWQQLNKKKTLNGTANKT